MHRKHVLTARIMGLAAIVLSFWVYSQSDVQPYALMIAVTGIVSMVAPEAVDKLPWGPSKRSL